MELNRAKASDISADHGQYTNNQPTDQVRSWSYVVASSPPKPGAIKSNPSVINGGLRWTRQRRQIRNVSDQPVALLKPCSEGRREVNGSLKCAGECTQVEQINRLLHQGGKDCVVKAATLLNQLLQSVDSSKRGVTGSVQPAAINRIKSRIYKALFGEVFDKYKTAMAKKQGFAYVSKALIDCKADCLRNSDFLFLLRDDYIRSRWFKIASMPWRDSMYGISREGHSVCEQDINELCDLIKASPVVSDRDVRGFFYRALHHTFYQYKDRYTDFDDKIKLLATWVEHSGDSKVKSHPACKKWQANHCAAPVKSRHTETASEVTFSGGESAVGECRIVEPLSIPENCDVHPSAQDSRGAGSVKQGEDINKTVVINEIWAPDLIPDIQLEYSVYDFDDDRLDQGQRLIVRAIAGLEEIVRYQFHSDADRNEWIHRMVDYYDQGVQKLLQWMGGQPEWIDVYNQVDVERVLSRLFLEGGESELSDLFDYLVDTQKQLSPDNLSVIEDASLLRDWLLNMRKRFNGCGAGNQKSMAHNSYQYSQI